MSPKLVLDTNLVVSAHLNSDGLERLVLNLALASQVEVFVMPEILEEYREVLGRKKFKIDPSLVEESLRLIEHKAILVQPRRRLSVSPDPDDNKFLECAETAGADFLVTGNKRHFPKAHGRTKVVNARELIAHIIPFLEVNDQED